MSKATASFYNTQAWQTCRAAYLKSRGGLCEVCLSQGLIVPAEAVHHRTHITVQNMDDPNITLNWNNLQALCRDHHAMMHKGERRQAMRYYFDEDGRVITIGD